MTLRKVSWAVFNTVACFVSFSTIVLAILYVFYFSVALHGDWSQTSLDDTAIQAFLIIIATLGAINVWMLTNLLRKKLSFCSYLFVFSLNYLFINLPRLFSPITFCLIVAGLIILLIVIQNWKPYSGTIMHVGWRSMLKKDIDELESE